AAAELLAEQREVQAPVGDLGHRVVTFGERPDAPVPHHDVAGAVLTGRDDTLEVVVVERVVLDVHREASDVRVERRSFGDRPADEDAIGFQAGVVVEVAGAGALYGEPPALTGGGGGARGPRAD